jgi:hypothetical protein
MSTSDKLQYDTPYISLFRYLRQLSATLRVGTGLPKATLVYLKKRAERLSARERLVSIIIDEVYTARQVEYSNGQFYGNENGEPTKTLLCMMLKCVAGSYSDVVAMVPLTSINSGVIKEWWSRVVQEVTPMGFDIVATIVDAHSSNRRFYTEELCGGSLQTYIPHPVNSGSKIFLLFDSVHAFKNIYNNLINKGEFKCPPFAGKPMAAKAQHVRDLYQLEMGRSVKYGHKLTERVLNPKSIEKTNVDLACRFFHESTVHGLQYFAKHEGKSEWEDTANFFQLVLRFWNTVNVKNPRSGFQKRDDTRRPISVNDKDQSLFLEAFVDWLDKWEEMKQKKNALTRETFIAVKQTAATLPELADYLLVKKGLKFVLLGMINSDPLEKRFGWFRQLSGANYYASVRQFLEAEKKIRIKCLVKHGQVSLQEVRESFRESSDSDKIAVARDTATLICALPSDSLSSTFELEKGEEGIIFFVAGYISRSVLRTVKCDGCVTMLRKSEDAPPVEFEDVTDCSVREREAREAYLTMINRGGLVTPSDLVNVTCVHAVQLKNMIFDNGDVQRVFLESGCPRHVFVQCYTELLQRESRTESLLTQLCSEGHKFEEFIPKIATRIFNIFSKNYISELNDKIQMSRKRDAGSKECNTSRKISKLQSDKGI